MPRIALSITSLIMLTGTALIAANDNPFARWEKLQSETEPTASGKSEAPKPTVSQTSAARPKTKAGAVAFFSAKQAAASTTPVVKPAATTPAVTVAATGNKSPVTAGPVKRERLRTGVLEKETAVATPAGPTNVKTAEFQGDAKGNIQQTAADFLDSFGAEEAVGEPNPFEEFLGNADRSQSDDQFSAAAETRFDIPEPADQAASTQFDVPASTNTSDFTNVGFGNEVETNSAFGIGALDASLPAVLSGPQSPTVTLQWIHHGEFSLGQESRCDLVVENTGRTLVRNVVAEALLPQGLQVVQAEPAPTSVEGTATWTFGELQAGEKRTIELVVIPEQQGDTQVSAFVRMTGASMSTFAVTQPELAVKIDGPQGIEVGQKVNYSVQVKNTGSGTARNVVIQAVIPEGLEHRQGGMLAIDIGTLNPGEQRRARLSVTGVKGGDHQLAVRIVGDGGLQEQATEVVAIAEPRLNIGVRGQAVVRAGQVAEYELIVVNEGRVDSSNVRAKYKVPAGFEFVKADLGGKYNAQDDTINWFVGTLEPDMVRQFHVSLRPTVPGAARHQVGVISEHGKMTMADHETTVQGNAELDVKLAADRRQVAPGDQVTYEIRVNNVGQSTAQNVGVSFELPPGLELSNITAPSEYVSDNGVVIFRSLPGLEAGKSVKITVQAKCGRAGTHRVRVRVASESIEEALIDEASTIAKTR